MAVKNIILHLALLFAKRPTQTTAATEHQPTHLMVAKPIGPIVHPNVKRHIRTTAATAQTITQLFMAV